MTDVSQEMAERLMAGARRDTSRGRYPEAVEQQREAVRVLEQGLASLAQDSPALADERKEYAHRLSNCWGRLGGIYRRAYMIAEAVNAYQHGMEIERQYRLDDSYNLTNWIVLQLLDDPLRLDDLTGEIEDAIALIEVQVAGPRRNQWWAWADLGLLYHLDQRVREARRAYERFQQADARRVDYKSVLEVLSSLQAALAPSESGLAAELEETIEILESASARL